ncbi:transposase [Metallosphaera yellowstonensis]|uniref:transposase n=1 Tax=Metallosphaera yellowstonensis TaxID=1111107 RepID=UPI003CCB16CA
MRVNEFKTEIELAREMLDVLKESFQWPGSSSTPVLSEKLVRDNLVSELKSNRAQGRVGPGDPRGGGGTPPSGRPPGVYYADLTLGGRAITVKLLVQERKRDSGTQARYLYTTDLSLSEEVEEACCVGDRGPPKGRQGPWTGGLLVLGGFRVTSGSSPSTTSSGSWWGS